MLRARRDPQSSPVTAAPRRLLWGLLVLDAMAASWMYAAGDWLDRASRVTAVITLGGHHHVVLVLAIIGLLTLATLAALTGGFTLNGRAQLAVGTAAAVVSIVALAGALSVIVLAVGVVSMICFVCRPRAR